MTSIAKTIRHNREMNRSRRAVNKAIAQASTPSLRNELIVISQRDGFAG